MKTTVLLNVAEDLPARAFCVANVRDKTVIKWLGVAADRPFDTTLSDDQRPCIVVKGSRYGETCTAHVYSEDNKIPYNTPVSLKPARPAEAESDGQLDP